MSYIVLARKYRPRTFDDVIGQEAIATTLKNAINMKRVAHAYLFCGPRGVGKTSMARIFAKALNNEGGSKINPDLKSKTCIEIDQGRSLDVIEIDGASNRGIDDVRQIRESIKFSPTSGNYKIYIIDEVHQITTDAFNALLKTLEEPPAHAKFIFATTSPEKVPVTILSRCQRYDFKRISTDTIAKALTAICKTEKIKIDQDALTEIAKAADGSLRDAQSLLDRISSFSKQKVGVDQVVESLGLIRPLELVELFNAIAQKDCQSILSRVEDVINRGQDLVSFVEKAMEHTRNLMTSQISESALDLIDAQVEYVNHVKNQKQFFSQQDLFYIFIILSQAVQQIKRLGVKRVVLEVALLKCAFREPMSFSEDKVGGVNPDHSLSESTPPKSKLSQKKTKIEEVKSTEEVKPTSEPESQPESSPQNNMDEDIPSESNKQAVERNSQPLISGEVGEIWPNLMKRIKEEKMSAASYLMEASPLDHEEDTVVIGFPEEFSFHAEALAVESNLRLIEKHLSSLLKKETRVKFILQETDDEGSKEEDSSKEDDSIIESAVGIFGGRVIKK